MKKRILIAAFAAVGGAALFLNGCSKDEGDTTPPVITISGSSSVDVVLNSSYTDAGASATDDKDGAVTVTTSNPVDVDNAKSYTVTYSASDAAGNTGTASRTVNVKNDAAYLEGTYDVLENGVTTFTQDITVSKTLNNQLWFSKFANYATNDSITALVSSTKKVDVNPSPSYGNVIGSTGCNHSFTTNGTGQGATIVVISNKATFSIKFYDEQLAGGGGCPATSPVPFEDVFTQH